MSPASLRDFLAKQTGANCAYNIGKRKKRWVHWRERIEAVCLHNVVSHVLITALQGRRVALAAARSDWPALWKELRADPDMELPDAFISDADAAAPPARRRGRPSLRPVSLAEGLDFELRKATLARAEAV